MSGYHLGKKRIRTAEIRPPDGSFEGYHLIPEPDPPPQSVHMVPPLIDQMDGRVPAEVVLGKLWHVAWCLTCTDGESGEVPFLSQKARSAWVKSHQESTGHKGWRLVSVRKHPGSAVPGRSGGKA